jgi:hypothetical protein
MTDNNEEIYSGKDSLNLTDKQQKAYELCLKLTSEQDREKRFLTQKILSKGIYSSRNQAKKALKRLQRMEKTKLQSSGNKVTNSSREKEVGGGGD